MEFLIIYGLFALSVGVVGSISLTHYIMRELYGKGVENQVTEHPVLAYVSMFIIHVLIAPAIAWVLISSDRTNRLQTALLDVLAQD